MKKLLLATLLLTAALTQLQTNAGIQHLQCKPKDMSGYSSVIPHAPLAQLTDQTDRNAIGLRTYRAETRHCTGLPFKPGYTQLQIKEN